MDAEALFKPPKTTYYYEWFIFTNVSQPRLHGRLRCEKPFVVSSSPVVHSSVNQFTMMVAPVEISSSEYELTYTPLDTIWNPSHPAYVSVNAETRELGNCSFTPLE